MSTAKPPQPAPAAPETLVQDPALRQAMRAHIQAVIQGRVCRDGDRRAEALRDYLSVTNAAHDQAAADTLSTMVPPLLPSLYRRWAGMFADRLFQTASEEQLRTLCDGTEDNGAALALAFVMFLESERMERQMSEDLCALGRGGQQGADAESQMADMAAGYIRARVAELAREQADAGKKRRKG